MQLSRSRYVTVCQQLLVTGAVLVLGLSAAGVRTLEIVAPDSQAPRSPSISPVCGLEQAPGAARRWPAPTHDATPTGCRPAGAPAPATHR